MIQTTTFEELLTLSDKDRAAYLIARDVRFTISAGDRFWETRSPEEIQWYMHRFDRRMALLQDILTSEARQELQIGQIIAATESFVAQIPEASDWFGMPAGQLGLITDIMGRPTDQSATIEFLGRHGHYAYELVLTLRQAYLDARPG